MHGDVGVLQWGTPSDNGLCQTNIPASSRLGTLAGDTAAVTMLMTSCTLRVDAAWPTYKGQASRHFLGYHNSPYIGYDEPRKVFKRSQDGQRTVDAWLEEMVLNGSGKNSPVAFTLGTSPEEAASMHSMTYLASGTGLLQNVGEPADGYYFELYDSGCTEACGACSGNAAPPPTISLGDTVSRVTLKRASPSATELVGLASTLLARFAVEPDDADVQARLDAWASQVVASGDLAHARVVDEPEIDVAYDPASGLLWFANRSALAAARPMPGQPSDSPIGLEEQLRLEAEAVRDDLATSPGLLDFIDEEPEVITRRAGFGGGDEPTMVGLAFEYLFRFPGRFQGMDLLDRSLGVGVTRLGEVSTISVSLLDLAVVGHESVEQTPTGALEQLRAGLLTQNPEAWEVEFVEPRVGYALLEGQVVGDAGASLVVGYVLSFGTPEDPQPSRQLRVRVPLTVLEGIPESLGASEPNPHGGDSRGAN